MTTIQALAFKPSLASKARKLRLSGLLTQQELAVGAGVSRSEVNRLERGLPLPLDSKRRILKELWAKKAGK